MSSTHTLSSVPVVRYRDTEHVSRAKADRELLSAGALFAALAIAGTAFFFAAAPQIANLAALYVSTT